TLFFPLQLAERDEVPVQHVLDFRTKDVSEATGHARAEIEAERAKDDGHAARHVLAAVLPDTFDNGQRSAIANSEAFPGASSDVKLAGSGAIENGVSDKHVSASRGGRAGGNGERAPGKALPDVVVRFAAEGQADARSQKGSEALAGAAVEFLQDFLSG